MTNQQEYFFSIFFVLFILSLLNFRIVFSGENQPMDTGNLHQSYRIPVNTGGCFLGPVSAGAAKSYYVKAKATSADYFVPANTYAQIDNFYAVMTTAGNFTGEIGVMCKGGSNAYYNAPLSGTYNGCINHSSYDLNCDGVITTGTKVSTNQGCNGGGANTCLSDGACESGYSANEFGSCNTQLDSSKCGATNFHCYGTSFDYDVVWCHGYCGWGSCNFDDQVAFPCK